MKNLLRNWKTTSAGILAIAGGIALYVNDKTKIMEALTAILSGIGLLVASDSMDQKKTNV